MEKLNKSRLASFAAIGEGLELCADGVLLLTADMQVLAANRALARLLTLPAPLLLPGTHLRRLLKDMAGWVAFDDHGSAEGFRRVVDILSQPVGTKVPLPAFSRDERRFNWWCQPGPRHSRAVMVQERSPTEDRLRQALADQKTFLQHVIDAMPAPLYLKTPDGHFRRCNTAFAALIGQDAAALVGQQADDVLPAALARAMAAQERPLLETPGTAETEVSFMLDGDARAAILSSATLLAPSGAVGGVFGALIDITSLKRAREEVAQAAQRLTDILDRSPVGVAISDLETGRFQFYNPRFVALLGGEAAIEGQAFDDSLLVASVARQGLLDGFARQPVIENVELRVKIDGEPLRWFLTTLERLDFAERPSVLWWIRDITKQKLSEQQLKLQASEDPLTGLANRARFTQRLDEAEALLRAGGRQGAIMLIDLDGFKTINDTFGHACGDWVLAETARRLQRSLRGADTVARLGGDEFTALFLDKGGEGAMAGYAQAFLDAMAKPLLWNDQACRVGASVGIAIFDGHLRDMREELRRADLAMYAAKKAGKGQYRFAPLADDTD